MEIKDSIISKRSSVDIAEGHKIRMISHKNVPEIGKEFSQTLCKKSFFFLKNSEFYFFPEDYNKRCFSFGNLENIRISVIPLNILLQELTQLLPSCTTFDILFFSKSKLFPE